MGGGEVVPVADKDLEAAYGIEKRQEVNIDNKDRYTEEKQDKGEKEKVEGYGFEKPQTSSREYFGGESVDEKKEREYFGGESVDEKKEKDKKRKNAEKERNKDKDPEMDKGKKYKGVVEKNDQKDKEKMVKEKKDRKLYDVYGEVFGKEDEGKELKENKVKKEKKKKKKTKDDDKTDKEDNYIAEKLKKKLIKLDAKLEKILAQKEDYVQKLKEVEGRPAHNFIAVANYDSVIASKLDTGSLERGMRLMNVSGSTREESMGMNKGKNNTEDADAQNKDDKYKKGEDVKEKREEEVSYIHGVKSCTSRELMDETEAREWKHKKDDKRKEKKGKNKAKFNVQKSNKKLAELYDKLGYVLSETKDYLQSLKEAERRNKQDADTCPPCQSLNDHKSKDMENLVKETLSLSVSHSTHNKKDEFNASDKGCIAQDGWITYPKLDEKDICGVGY